MEHNEDSQELVRPGGARGPWLAMQSAYAEYRQASEALASGGAPIDDLSGWRSLEAQQRAAFEKYLETRMAYLESRFDETSGENPVDAPTRELASSTIASRFGRYGLVFLAVAILLVSMAAVSLVRAQKRVRDLETARDDLRAKLAAATDDIQRVASRVDAWKPSPTAPEVQRQPVAASPQPASRARSARAVRRNYRFLLTPSHQFKRVGPIEVSVRSVDTKQNRINLSILSESVKLNLQHVRLNQPVRIDGGRGPRMELVVDRIAEDGVHGHLIEFQS
jgi:hypothetical protein